MKHALLAATTLAIVTATAAIAQPFTYQGELTNNGQPATGSFDVLLTVHSASTGNAQVGAQTLAANTPLTNGRFTATVNPGTDVFNGSDRWLEVAVRPSGSGGGYTTLTPRQKITAAPYAIRSLSDRWIQNGPYLSNDQTQVNSLLLNRNLPITGADYFTLGTPATFGSYGGMYIDTASTQGLPFYGYATGGLARAWTYLNGVDMSWNVINNGNNAITVDSTGKVAIGMTPIGADRFQVAGSSTTTGTAKAADLRYTNPQTRQISISPVAFQANSGAQGTSRLASFSWVYLDTPVLAGTLSAPLQLPPGAIVTSITAYFYDNSPTVDMSLSLVGADLFNSFGTTYASVQSSGSANIVNSFSQTLATPLTIDMVNRCYNLEVFCNDWQGALTRLQGVKLTYTVPAPD
jgi:hypothetical protein